MKRLLQVVFLACSLMVLVGLIVAGGDRPASSFQTRQAEFARDAALIEAFIDGGLQLAVEEDPLRRAQTCNILADKLAQEIRAATEKKANDRVVVLGELLQTVLVQGVADNLERARNEVSKEPVRAKEISRVAEQAAEVAGPVELSLKKTLETLKGPPDKEAMWPALKGLARAREEVESASMGKGRSKDKGMDKGKDKGKGKGKKKW